MFLGHFGIALAAKKATPKTSLGTLVFAAQLADLLWPIFLLLHWEQVRIVPGNTRVVPLEFTSYPHSHSLLALLLWGLAIGLAYFAFWQEIRSALVVALIVPSHWLLDFVAHGPDMPIVHGGSRFGLGMWNSLPVTVFVECTLYGLGIALYLNTTRAMDRVGKYALWSLLIFLLVAWFSSVFGPPPPNVNVLAFTALGIWLTVPWAAWADEHRSLV